MLRTQVARALGLQQHFGEALAVLCQKWLDGARARLDAAEQPG